MNENDTPIIRNLVWIVESYQENGSADARYIWAFRADANNSPVILAGTANSWDNALAGAENSMWIYYGDAAYSWRVVGDIVTDGTVADAPRRCKACGYPMAVNA